MACSHLLRGQAFKVSGRLLKRIEEGLTKTEEHFGKAGGDANLPPRRTGDKFNGAGDGFLHK